MIWGLGIPACFPFLKKGEQKYDGGDELCDSIVGDSDLEENDVTCLTLFVSPNLPTLWSTKNSIQINACIKVNKQLIAEPKHGPSLAPLSDSVISKGDFTKKSLCYFLSDKV